MDILNGYDVIVIGAGAAGLAATLEMARAGRKVLVLEARDRAGGRIYTIEDKLFAQPAEAGAEFIHGRLPSTLLLLDKGGIAYNMVNGRSWHVNNGKVEKEKEFIRDWDLLIRKLNGLEQDQTIARFLNASFAGEEYKELRKEVLQFTQGYNAANPERASALSLKEEWEAEDEKHQYRVEGGYCRLIDFLVAEVSRTGATVQFSSVVKEIRWKKGEAEVITNNNKSYYSSRILVTVPLGVLQAKENSEASIRFSPALPEKAAAIQQMGFGAVIKLHLQFENNFWEERKQKHTMNNAGFIFSDAFIPTWWTQCPNTNGLLTGWLAGPKAYDLKNTEDGLLLEKAIEAVSYIFCTGKPFILRELKAWKIHNWAARPFSLGAYSYATLQTRDAINVITKPSEEVIYFAGEALYKGPYGGTVEAALVNGIETARQMIVS